MFFFCHFKIKIWRFFLAYFLVREHYSSSSLVVPLKSKEKVIVQMLGTSLCSGLTQIQSAEHATVNDRLILKEHWKKGCCLLLHKHCVEYNKHLTLQTQVAAPDLWDGHFLVWRLKLLILRFCFICNTVVRLKIL